MLDLMAVCDKCKVKERIGGRKIPGWEEREEDSFFQRHANCNHSGCRVVLEHDPCPNRARDYAEESTDKKEPEFDPWDGGYEALREQAIRRGELLNAAYLLRLIEVWDTRHHRVRGFKGVPGAMSGECGLCYRKDVSPESVEICTACRERDPELAAKFDKAKV